MSLATRLAGISPFGPIFGKELRTTARRRRTYVLRVVYIGLLLFPLIMVFIASAQERQFSTGVAMRNQEQAQLGQIFFGIFAVFSVWMMGLIGPVLTANSVGSERLQKTLPVLLMTPISAWQIVSGKLFSRLLVAFTLIGLGLPVLALVRLLGGVELTSMLSVIGLALVAAMSAAAIGLFFSTLLNRAYAVILLSFGFMLFLYLFVPMVIVLSWEAGRRGPGMEELIFSINPYAMATAMADPDNGSRPQFIVPLAVCLGSHILLTAILLTWSALIIRRRARRAGAVDVALPRVTPPPMPLVTPPPLPATSGTISVTPPAAKSPRPQRAVSDNPILWRETRRPLLARKWQRVVALCVVGGMLLTLYVLVGANNGLKEPDAQIAWACAFNALFCILTLVISSTAIAQEKESDTWTLLTATSLSGRAIVWGKAIGMMRRLFWPFIFICMHFALFTVCGVISPGAALLAVWIIFSANTIWIATGVYFSLRFKHVTVAVIANLLMAISLYLVLLGILGLLSLAYDRNLSGDDLQRMVIARTILEIFGAVIVGYWLLTLYHAFTRPRGALGRLLIATLLLIIVLATANSTTQIRGEPVEQAGWYTPYYILAELPWRSGYEFYMRMPDHEHFTQSQIWLFCWGFGVAHLLVSAAILGFASLKFSGIVGRAPQKQSWPGRWKDESGGNFKPILSGTG